MGKSKFTLQAIIVAVAFPVLICTGVISPAKALAELNISIPPANEVTTSDRHDKSAYAVYPELVYPHFVNY